MTPHDNQQSVMTQLLQAVDRNCVATLRRHLPQATAFTATYVLMHADQTGKAACVAELLPAADPKLALSLSVEMNNYKLFCRWYPLSNVQELYALAAANHIPSHLKNRWNDFEARYQRKLLNKQVQTLLASSRKTSSRKKM